MRARVGDAHGAVGRDHFGFEQSGRGHAVVLREAAEAAAGDEARDADRRAAAALHVASGLRRHRVVDGQPARARLHRHGRRRVHLAHAAGGRERVVQRDGVHRPRPDQQRVRRVRRALVAVPAALHDDAQVVRAREVHGGRDVGGLLRRDRVCAGRGTPTVHPAGGLRACRLLADEIRIAQVAQDVVAGGAGGRAGTRFEQRRNLDQLAADPGVELVPQRRRRPGRIRGAHAPHRRGGGGCRRMRAEQRQQRRGSGRLEKASSFHCCLEEVRK